ncbi:MULTISPECIES: hypothetical protein [Lachnospiraceae]
MKMKIKGLDELEKQLKQMEKGAKELDGTHSVPFGELFTPSFMKKYTSFSSMDELLNAGGFKVESQEDFKNIPEDEFDKHIATSTNFSTWKDMLGKASQQYAAKKLGF